MISSSRIGTACIITSSPQNLPFPSQGREGYQTQSCLPPKFTEPPILVKTLLRPYIFTSNPFLPIY